MVAMAPEHLKEERARLGLSQQGLADLLNDKLGRRFDKARVSKWESGKEDVPSLVALCMRTPEVVTRTLCIAVANQKGGVGKTTSSLNLGYALAAAGNPTLVVDLDQQCNATISVGQSPIDNDATGHTLYHAMLHGKPVIDAIHPVKDAKGLDVLGNGQFMARFEIEAVSAIERERLLARTLKPVLDRYRFIIIDCPPSMSIATTNALFFVDWVLIPTQTEALSVTGIPLLLSHIELIAAAANPDLRVLGILPTMFKARNRTDQYWFEYIENQYGQTYTVFPPVPQTTAYPTSVDAQRIAFEMVPEAKGLESYGVVAERLVEIARLKREAMHG